MRIAAIDIGTNSIHMIVVRVRPDLSFEVVDREKEMVRLGAGGLDGRSLAPAATTAALQALAKFRRLADSREVDEIIATATSAVREAHNGAAFLRRVAAETGIRVRVISGAEEAHLIHRAAVYGTGVGRSPAVVIDIGGGSVEITHGSATRVRLARSFKIGVIRLTERFVRSDPLTRRDERRIARYVTDQTGAFVARVRERGFTRVIGTSGTILSLGTLGAIETTGAAPSDLRNLRVSAKAIRRVRKQVVSLDLEERLQVPGLDPRRADLAVAGAVLLDTLLSELAADEITLCDLALREGLILDYIRRNPRQIASIEHYPDVRRRSVVELADRCQAWTDHARHVSYLALRLFDQTRQRHGLSMREREWLEFGALLHDIGGHISYKAHHKHSEYLIRNGDLRGFDPDEIEVVGLVARYHRQATPKKSHDGFGQLPAATRKAVRVLAACLRLAEGLDRSHAHIVRDLRVVERNGECVIRVRAQGDAELELWAANRHRKPFERDVAGAPVTFEVTTGVRDQGSGLSRRQGSGVRAQQAPGLSRGQASGVRGQQAPGISRGQASGARRQQGSGIRGQHGSSRHGG